MMLNTLDWAVVAGALLLAFVPVVIVASRANRGIREFFGSGQSAPWWLIGTSMVATTFSTDTPNLVTQLVRDEGVSGNWVWWAFLLTGMATVFFYARLWRRLGVLTDLEFYELRYAGRSATAVRAFRAVYLGVFANCVIMAMVTLAATKIATILLGWEQWQTLLVCAGLSILFSSMSGLWGVLVSDIVQFAIAMVGVIAAAWFALDHEAVGGLSGMLAQTDPATLRLLPDFTDWEVSVPIFLIPIAVMWWAAWYPGAEPGGGSYIAQRILAAKSEGHALGATLWFNVAHYAVRPWPWIIVALCSMIVFPTTGDLAAAFPEADPSIIGSDAAYPAMLSLLPHGLLGLLMASLVSAYISTMSTHLNWGASYLVNDLYKRFATDEAGDGPSEKKMLLMSRVVTVALAGVAMGVTPFLDSATSAFGLILQIGAGTGSIYLLRWFWWRVNAWSEIAGMVTSFVLAIVTLVLNNQEGGSPFRPEVMLVGSVVITTVVWVLVTLVTAPAPMDRLVSFYELVRPAGPGWSRVRRESSVGSSPDSLAHAFLGWFAGCALVYGALFAVGNGVYGRWGYAIGAGAAALVAGVVLVRLVPAMLRGLGGGR